MRAIVNDTVRESNDIWTFRLTTEHPLDYIAGQFVELTLPHSADSRGITRWFTLSSSPTEPFPSVSVRFADVGSSFKQQLQKLPVGAELQISDPLGDFVLPRNPDIPLLWIAGGIGITPFRSHAAWLKDMAQKRAVTLLHQTGPTTALWHKTFSEAAIKQHSFRNRGELRAALGRHVAPGSLCYIAGTPAFIAAVSETLVSQKLPYEDIITDAFLGYR